MENHKKRPRVRLMFCRASSRVKVAATLAIVLSMAALLTLGILRSDVRAQTRALGDNAAALQAENDRLVRNIDELGTVQSILRIAREELGLVKPDTVFFHP